MLEDSLAFTMILSICIHPLVLRYWPSLLSALLLYSDVCWCPGLTSPVTVGGSCRGCSSYGCGLGVAIGSGGGGSSSSRVASLETHTHTRELTHMPLREETPELRCVNRDGIYWHLHSKKYSYMQIYYMYMTTSHINFRNTWFPCIQCKK